MPGSRSIKTSTSDLENGNNEGDSENDDGKMGTKEDKDNKEANVEKDANVSGIQFSSETDPLAESSGLMHSSMNLDKDNTVIVIIVNNNKVPDTNSQTSTSEALSDAQKATSTLPQGPALDSVSEQSPSNVKELGEKSDSIDQNILTQDKASCTSNTCVLLSSDIGGGSTSKKETLPVGIEKNVDHAPNGKFVEKKPSVSKPPHSKKTLPVGREENIDHATNGILVKNPSVSNPPHSKETLPVGSEENIEHATNGILVKNPSVSNPPHSDKKNSEFVDNTDDSMASQIPSRSPWGPPHEEHLTMHSLHFDNPHKKLQADIRADYCCCCCRCVFQTRFDVKDEKESAINESMRMKQDDTKCPHCSCNCVGSHLSVSDRTRCLLYPVFPMYCFQPMECCSSTCGCKSAEKEQKFPPHNDGCKGFKKEEQIVPLLGNVFPLLFANFDHCNKLKSNIRTSCVDESHNAASNRESVNMRRAGLENNNTNSHSRSRDSFSQLSDLKDIDLDRPKAHVMHRPPTVICYICGREYGTASIAIHEKQCLEIWRKMNSQLPKAKRRPEPIKPTLPGPSGSEGLKISGKPDYDSSSLNEAAFESFQQQYVKCERCGRSFLPESLYLHSNGCRGYHSIVRR